MRLTKKICIIFFIFLFACNKSEENETLLIDTVEANNAFSQIIDLDIDSIKLIIDEEIKPNNYQDLLVEIVINSDTKLFDKKFDIFFDSKIIDLKGDSIICALTLSLDSSFIYTTSHSSKVLNARREIQQFMASKYDHGCIDQTMTFVRMLEKYSFEKTIGNNELGYLLIYDYLLHRLTYMSVDRVR